MGIRSHLAIAAGKTSQWVLQTFFKAAVATQEISPKNRS